MKPVFSLDVQTLERLLDAETLLHQESFADRGKTEKIVERLSSEHTVGERAGLDAVESLTEEQLRDLYLLILLGRDEIEPVNLDRKRAELATSPHVASALYGLLHKKYVHKALGKLGKQSLGR